MTSALALDRVVSIIPHVLPALDPTLAQLLGLEVAPSEGYQELSDSTRYAGSVPIYKDASIYALLQQHEHALARQDEQQAVGAAEPIDVDQALRFYLPLGEFAQPPSPWTLTLRGFPSLSNHHDLETALERLVGGDPFKWSIITSEHIDNRLVFVRVDSLAVLQKTVRTIRLGLFFSADNSAGLSVAVDHRVEVSATLPSETPAAPSLEESQSAQLEAPTAGIELASLFSQGRAPASEPSASDRTNELLYSKYKIESSELVDVPVDYRPTVVKDIIQFRTRVLKIEQEKRVKEMEAERKKAKQRLRKLFEDIQEANGEMVTGTLPDSEDDEDQDDVGPQAMTDEEAFEHAERQQREALDREYAAAEALFVEHERTQRTTLLSAIRELKAYSSSTSARERKLAEYSTFQDFGVEERKTYAYYKNHSAYAKTRLQLREREAARDAADREAEAVDKASMAKADEFLSSLSAQQPVKLSLAAAKEEPLDVGAISAAGWVAITAKIAELVEEYLGDAEEELALFILAHVRDGARLRAGLTAELEETLDEDAAELVTKLWLFMEEQGAV